MFTNIATVLFKQGYRENGGEVNEELLLVIKAFDMILGILLHIESWPKEEWFIKKLFD